MTTLDIFSNISGALAQTFGAKLARQWNRQVVLARSIPIVAVTGQGYGQNVAWDVEFGGADADTFAEGADVGSTDFSYDAINQATLNWGRYRSNFALSFDEIDKASANVGNADELGKMFEERFLGAITKIASKINVDLFSGTGSGSGGGPTIVGLDAALAATGTYGGLDKSTYPMWAGNVAGNSSVDRPLTLNLMSTAENLGFIASGFSPNRMITTPATRTKYENIFTPSMRTVSDGRAPVQSFQGSAGGLNWRGNEIIRDKDATAKRLYMLLEEDGELELRVLPPAGWSDMSGQIAGGRGAAEEPLPIPCRVYRVPQAGSRVAFSVEVRCQLKVTHPNRHVMITDISES